MAFKNSTIKAIALPMTGLVAMLFFFYAFIQKAEADKHLEYANQERRMNNIRQVKLKDAGERMKKQDSVIQVLQLQLSNKKLK